MMKATVNRAAVLCLVNHFIPVDGCHGHRSLTTEFTSQPWVSADFQAALSRCGDGFQNGFVSLEVC